MGGVADYLLHHNNDEEMVSFNHSKKNNRRKYNRISPIKKTADFERVIPSEDKLCVFKKWEATTMLVAPEEGAFVDDLQDYTIEDSEDVRDLIINDKNGSLVVAKVSRRKALPHGVN